MYFVYILKSLKDNRFYTGSTDNLERRLHQHNTSHKATKSTINRGPFSLVYVQICSNKEEALLLEKYLKSGSGREIRLELLELAHWRS